jgi:GNAT superfamily N-acetyltransferase
MASLVKVKKLSRLGHWIEDVVVLERYRDKGIGRALMEKVHWYAEQSGITILDLHSSRPGAIALYKKLGYRERGATKLMQRRA